MARYKDSDWNLPDSLSWGQVEVAVLMDIRDELKRLNSLLRCPNFIGIPFRLEQIVKNTKKPKRKRRKHI